MTSCFIFATLALALQQNGLVFGQVPSSMTAAELWNPSTWFYPYAIAISEGYRDYYVKAQKATNELYKQIYATNAFPWVTGNWGGQPTQPSQPSGGSGQGGQGGSSAPSTQPGQGGSSAPSTQPEQNPSGGTGGSSDPSKQDPTTTDSPQQKPSGDGVNAQVQDENSGTGVGGGVNSEGPSADVNADTGDKEPTDEEPTDE